MEKNILISQTKYDPVPETRDELTNYATEISEQFNLNDRGLELMLQRVQTAKLSRVGMISLINHGYNLKQLGHVNKQKQHGSEKAYGMSSKRVIRMNQGRQATYPNNGKI